MNPPIHMPTTVIGYIRASTPQQRSTILTQYELIQRHCQTYGFALPQDVRRTVTLDDGTTAEITGCFIDAGVSAEKVDFLQREDAAAMLAYMGLHEIRDIIGTKVDRVFRDVDDCRFTVRSLEEAGTRFHLLDVGGLSVTVTTAAGLFFLTIMSAVAEYENGRRRERQTENYSSQRARRNATGTGVFFGAEPFGFTCQPHPTVTDARVLVRCPVEGPVLDRILTGDLAGFSANETARRLNAEGISTKKGGKWYGATVASVRKTSTPEGSTA